MPFAEFVAAFAAEWNRLQGEIAGKHEANAADLHGRWKSSNKLLRLYLRPASRRAVTLNELSNRLAIAADLRFDPQD